MQNQIIYDVNEQNIQQVLTESTQVPVLFYFYSDRSSEYQELDGVLTKIANEYQGQFILAKLDCDNQPMLAAQFGLRAIPTVYLFQNGQPIDGFQGSQSEEQIKALLQKVLPSADELMLIEATKCFEQGEFDKALPLLKQVRETIKDHLGNPRSDIALMLSKSMIEHKQINEAKEILATIARQDQDSVYHSLIAEIELLEQAANSPEIQQLKTEFSQQPENMALLIQLASSLVQVGQHEEALELLFAPLLNDLNTADGQVKKTLLDVLNSLGTNNPLAASYRRKLYSLLY